MRCTINFLLISGIVKRERKILKGTREEGKARGETTDRKKTGKKAVPSDGLHCGIARKTSPG